jgi:hypothetical protein
MKKKNTKTGIETNRKRMETSCDHQKRANSKRTPQQINWKQERSLTAGGTEKLKTT